MHNMFPDCDGTDGDSAPSTGNIKESELWHTLEGAHWVCEYSHRPVQRGKTPLPKRESLTKWLKLEVQV